jgi:hypoxanthine phosphoribosyltransferase
MSIALPLPPDAPKFTVRTLTPTALDEAARALYEQARAALAPNLVVGVRTGGYVVAERMLAAAGANVTLLPITCRRPSTGKKNRMGFVKLALKQLPRVVNDRLRIIEHKILTQRKTPQPVAFTPDAQELGVLRAHLAQAGAQARVLIVDDSVDSGATLQAVERIVREAAAPGGRVETAAITVTTSAPLLQPTYSLYRYVLCRFPWSLDFAA